MAIKKLQQSMVVRLHRPSCLLFTESLLIEELAMSTAASSLAPKSAHHRAVVIVIVIVVVVLLLDKGSTTITGR